MHRTARDGPHVEISASVLFPNLTTRSIPRTQGRSASPGQSLMGRSGTHPQSLHWGPFAQVIAGVNFAPTGFEAGVGAQGSFDIVPNVLNVFLQGPIGWADRLSGGSGAWNRRRRWPRIYVLDSRNG
jgi:hypothetical protein